MLKTKWILFGAAGASLFATSCLSTVKKSAARDPASYYAGGYDYMSYLIADTDQNATCAEFFEMLGRGKPETVQGALNILKKERPKYFSSYSLAPRSFSLHGSSWSYPRAIVYGGDGRMTLTFNGHPDQASYESIEVMCFNEADATYTFHDITFPKEAAAPVEYLTTKQMQEPFVISPVDGYPGTIHDCRGCHQSPARPNWDNYSRWPSLYGAMDDALFRPALLEELDRSAPYAYAYTMAEKEKFKTFAKTGRYEVLDENLRDRPNLVAGKIYTVQNARRVIMELSRLGGKFNKKAFARAVYCPIGNMDEKSFWVGPEDKRSGTTGLYLTKRVPQSVFKMAREAAGYERSVRSRLRENFPDLVERDHQVYEDLQAEVAKYHRSIGFSEVDAPYVPSGSMADGIIRLDRIQKYVKPFGVNVSNWSMVTNGGFSSEDGSSSPEYGNSFFQALDKPLLEVFFSEDERLIELVSVRRSRESGIRSVARVIAEEQAICDHLK